jgi:hypothetical protein
MRNAIVTFTLLGALASRAAAEPPPIPVEQGEPHKAAFDIGPWFPVYLVDHYSGIAIGARGAGWLKRGGWAFGVEGGVGRMWLTHENDQGTEDSPSIRGYMGRVGANLRWQTRVLNGDDDFAIDLWLQGGAGVHAIQWDGGGRIVRPDGLVGFGVTERFGRHKRYGLDAGVTVVVGHGKGGGMPTCAGPCDEPTAPVHYDVEIIDQIAFTETW